MNFTLDSVQQMLQDSVRRFIVVLTGAGRGFSSGADLSAWSTHPAVELGDSLREHLHPIVLALRNMSRPVITAVNGVAAGAGVSIALAGDVVLASKSAIFLHAFSRIGLVPNGGCTYFLPRYVGEMRARARVMLAKKIDAFEAQRVGMVWKVCPDEKAELDRMANHLANMPTARLTASSGRR
jgi:2-(1,2-epoxy-1,2-dihydrophenyl)acetyl-CoA isomerase